jgi:hypothetical protein
MTQKENFDVVLLCDNEKHAGLRSLLSWAANYSHAKLTSTNACSTLKI